MKSFDKLIALFRKFPGVGPKQAERFALYVIKAPGAQIEELAGALTAARDSVRYCAECSNFAEEELCPVCADRARDRSVICVVSQPQDVAAIEKTKTFNGVYHVLHGAISPMDGVTSEGLKLKELLQRVRASGGAVSELIIATTPDTEGETTAIYLTRILKDSVPSITRLACGVPLGGDINYMDEVTLGYALKGRTKI
ncbi:MAG: recombination protein RecR [Elusimicrobia bacterium RIFOXYB2_FULL_62_6]|nr:MAG: recombination protein RecR [Elusimicrobia bacterium RIFOXYB2_FULL_62_6]